MQQQLPEINIVIVKFKNPKSNELIIKAILTVIMSATKSRWYEKYDVNILIADPPAKYPIALARKIKEKYV